MPIYRVLSDYAVLLLVIVFFLLSTVAYSVDNHGHEHGEGGDHSHANEEEEHDVIARMENATDDERSNLNFKQLMEGFGEGAVLMQAGVLRQNPLLVRRGSELILGHKPPYHKPWVIVAKEEQEQFKQMLRAYNPVFHEMPEKIATAAEQKKWPVAQQEVNNMMSSCVSCHSIWKHKVVGYPPLVQKKAAAKSETSQ